MKKLIDFVKNHEMVIILVSLALLVLGCTIVGTCDLDPWWYIVPFVLGLPVLIAFIYVIVMFLIVTPIKKLINKSNKNK